MASLQLLDESAMRLDSNKRAFGVRERANFARKSVENRAKDMQNFQNFAAPRAQNLRALGQRAHDVATPLQ